MKTLQSYVLAALVVALSITSLHAEEITLDALKARITGLYTLEEWHKDGEVFRPPQVDGRFILINGTIMTILDNRIQPSSRSTTVLVGKYELTSDKFSYAYDDVSNFTEEADATKVSHKPLWEGMRTFVPSIDGDVVRLSADTGQEIVFADEGSKYFDKGKQEPAVGWRFRIL